MKICFFVLVLFFGFYTVTCSTGNGYFTKHKYTVRIQSIKIDNWFFFGFWVSATKSPVFFFFFVWGQRSEGKKNGKTFPCKDLVRNFDGQLVDTSKCDCYKMMKWAKIYNARAWLEILISWKSLFEIDLFDIQISIKLIGNEWIRMILFPSKYLSSNKNEENSITLFCIYTSYGKQDVYTKWNSPQSYSPCKADKHDL